MPTSYLRAEWVGTMKADHTLYSLHSLRKASATLAHSGGCSELEVQRHGGGRRVHIKPTSQWTITKSMTFYPLLLINHFFIYQPHPPFVFIFLQVWPIYISSYTFLHYLIQFYHTIITTYLIKYQIINFRRPACVLLLCSMR